MPGGAYGAFTGAGTPLGAAGARSPGIHGPGLPRAYSRAGWRGGGRWRLRQWRWPSCSSACSSGHDRTLRHCRRLPPWRRTTWCRIEPWPRRISSPIAPAWARRSSSPGGTAMKRLFALDPGMVRHCCAGPGLVVHASRDRRALGGGVARLCLKCSTEGDLSRAGIYPRAGAEGRIHPRPGDERLLPHGDHARHGWSVRDGV